MFGGSVKCKKCNKGAYANESIKYDNQVWHKKCFKCIECKLRVSLNSVAMLQSELYCKNCFIRLFSEKGSYQVFDEKKKDQKARSTSEPVTTTTNKSGIMNDNKPIIKVCAVAECDKPCVLKKLYCNTHANASQLLTDNQIDPVVQELINEITAKSVIGVRRIIDQHGPGYILSNLKNKQETPLEMAFTSGFTNGARLMIDMLRKKLDSTIEDTRRASITFSLKHSKSPVLTNNSDNNTNNTISEESKNNPIETNTETHDNDATNPKHEEELTENNTANVDSTQTTDVNIKSDEPVTDLVDGEATQ